MKSEVWGNGREFEEDRAGLEGTGEEVDDKEAEGNNWLRVRPLSLYLKTQKDHSLSLTARSASGGEQMAGRGKEKV